MPRSLSFFLDLIRFAAAVGVVFLHVNTTGFSNFYFLPEVLGHCFVILFFVVSGYVIAYTTDRRHKNVREYFVARISRIYSVLIPAIIFTIVVGIWVEAFRPDIYSHFDRGHTWLRHLLSLFCLNEVWFFSAASPLNIPLWSLSYEVCYYILWALALFPRRIATKVLLVGAGLLLFGPKVLVLMPAWLIGVGAYYFNKKNILSWRGVSFSLLGVLVLLVSVVDLGLSVWPNIFGRYKKRKAGDLALFRMQSN